MPSPSHLLDAGDAVAAILARSRNLASHLPGARYAAGLRARWRRPSAAPPAPTPMPRFCALLSERYGVADLDAERDPLRRMYLDFALSTVSRGEAAARELATHVQIRGKRYLDAGCAYGGFLVALHRAGAREVVGVDLNTDLLDYARSVLADHAIAARVERADLLDPRTADALGTFDLVTANDVIEHVVDPALGLERLYALLAPGGHLMLEIPNRFWPSFLRSDGHYQIAGICALPKRRADAYHRALRGAEQDVTYRQLGFYLRHLERLGARTRVLNAPPAWPGAALELIARDFYVCLEAIAIARAPPGPAAPLLDDARRRVVRLAAVFRRTRARYEALSATQPARAAALGRRLQLAFGESFWRLLVEKPAARGAADPGEGEERPGAGAPGRRAAQASASAAAGRRSAP